MLAAGGGDAVLVPLPPLLAGLGWHTQNETMHTIRRQPMQAARTARLTLRLLLVTSGWCT
ncbi:hypothetical protein PF010_g14967 [Phytophthora fragariae]|uniref:Uncharacterized protein n=1 Tax=Phytophthora fragariae TaxID=53985 RepID=A0A6A3U5X3_9STRA|nr:hypothetical protein PF003_g18880 [Phytophthora fragariae]KAE9100031.1 hypothetical protein PF010_g14967 [Phytophthora fragariae]KAE9145109.1 hypothetical protein PF006_g10001 [Phytophthora fragariae]